MDKMGGGSRRFMLSLGRLSTRTARGPCFTLVFLGIARSAEWALPKTHMHPTL